MSEWNNFSSSERMARWKELRTEVQNLDQQSQLTAVAKFFGTLPYSERTIDYYTPDSWPSPWDILYRNELCQSSIALLMYYTLELCDFEGDVELVLINDTTDTFLLVCVDNQYLLNYELCQVSNCLQLKDRFKIVEKFKKTEIKQYA